MGPMEDRRGEPGPRRIGLATSSPAERGETGEQAHCGRLPPHQIWP